MAYLKNLFSPMGATVNVAVTTTSASVAKTPLPANSGGGTHEIRLFNLGTVPVFIAFGASGVTTDAASGMPLAPNTAEKFTLSASETHIAAITASGTATLYATTGLGE